MVGFLLVGFASCGIGIFIFVFRNWSARMQREWSERHLPPALRGPVWLEPVTAIYGAALGIGFGLLMIVIALFRS